VLAQAVPTSSGFSEHGGLGRDFIETDGQAAHQHHAAIPLPPDQRSDYAIASQEYFQRRF